MALPLTFMDRKLTDSPVVGPDGGVYYTLSTTHGFRGRKITTITAASGLVGFINWRDDLFVINGVEKKWDHIRAKSGGIFSSEREWNWDGRPYTLKYQNSHKELLATPKFNSVAGTVRFTTYDVHLFHENDRAVLYLPHQMQDEIERMFLLMAILQTEMHHQDRQRGARNAGIVASASA
ncbi:hypothetical protein C8F04DRAFT_1096935 [Mycena alexandri]|uniref:DUF6593 domain-containing protein n=1 Tax=Mycena alexandri TaxID=1745969 RepID=A0AAD6SXH8_9AGAR|nr:hypothetical protein C8F04DRAFT_1096935 [Mycena alexandri]